MAIFGDFGDYSFGNFRYKAILYGESITCDNGYHIANGDMIPVVACN